MRFASTLVVFPNLKVLGHMCQHNVSIPRRHGHMMCMQQIRLPSSVAHMGTAVTYMLL